MLIDGSTLHVWTSGVDRTGRTRGDHATTAYPTPGSPQPGIPTGWATYQLGDSSTSVRDFRQLVRTSSGTSVALWLSFLQPYSSGGNDFWSDYFPVTVSSPSEALNFLLTVRGVRWQARLSNPAGAPVLDKVELTHAPVSFSPTGSGASTAIGPSAGRVVAAWHSVPARRSVFGKSVTLSGTASQGGAPLAGQAVALGAQPIGATVFTVLPPATTDAAGNYRALTKPTKKTTYKAGFTGVSPEPTAVVLVK